MGLISRNLPITFDQQGVWDGEYVHLDRDHTIVDRHRSRIICRIDDDEERPVMRQTNIYTWADGTREIRYFEATCEGDRVVYDNDLIVGWNVDGKHDPQHRTILVGWTRRDAPDIQFYEYINPSADGERKHRVWQWFSGGDLIRRTLINEVRASRDWRQYDAPEYYRTTARSKPG
jgi:hypothetical protein